MKKRKRLEKKVTTDRTVLPGPKPDLLKIDIGWQDAIKRAIEKKKPPEGWPK